MASCRTGWAMTGMTAVATPETMTTTSKGRSLGDSVADATANPCPKGQAGQNQGNQGSPDDLAVAKPRIQEPGRSQFNCQCTGANAKHKQVEVGSHDNGIVPNTVLPNAGPIGTDHTPASPAGPGCQTRLKPCSPSGLPPPCHIPCSPRRATRACFGVAPVQSWKARENELVSWNPSRNEISPTCIWEFRR